MWDSIVSPPLYEDNLNFPSSEAGALLLRRLDECWIFSWASRTQNSSFKIAVIKSYHSKLTTVCQLGLRLKKIFDGLQSWKPPMYNSRLSNEIFVVKFLIPSKFFTVPHYICFKSYPSFWFLRRLKPEDFMFQLTQDADKILRSQNVILKKGRGQHAKYPAYD